MKKYGFKIFAFCSVLVIFAGSFSSAQQPPPQQQPASVAGNWTLYCKDPNGSTSSKYLDLQQKGTVITGHFKGPNPVGRRGRHNRQPASRGSYEDARCPNVSRTG